MLTACVAVLVTIAVACGLAAVFGRGSEQTSEEGIRTGAFSIVDALNTLLDTVANGIVSIFEAD